MSPESRYRLLLRAYPRSYRAARGEEMLGVLVAAERGRGRRSALPEAASLVVHGVACRLRPTLAPGRVPSRGIAGVALLLLLTVLGAHELGAMALRGLGLDGAPASVQTGRLWVDPRWPVHLAWLATGAALLLRWDRIALALAWTAAMLLVWQGVAGRVTGFPLAWLGDLLGPTWVAPLGAGQVSWLLLTVLAAALISGPDRLARSLTSVPVRSWGRVLLAGVLASVASLAASPALAGLTAPDVRLGESARAAAAFALVASSAALVSALRHTSRGRYPLLLLVGASLIPVAPRWGALGALPIVVLGAAALTAVCAVVARRRVPGGPAPEAATLP